MKSSKFPKTIKKQLTTVESNSNKNIPFRYIRSKNSSLALNNLLNSYFRKENTIQNFCEEQLLNLNQLKIAKSILKQQP